MNVKGSAAYDRKQRKGKKGGNKEERELLNVSEGNRDERLKKGLQKAENRG